ncbi:MAG: Rossmann fold domain-containing protein [Novosphingobium sp.]
MRRLDVTGLPDRPSAAAAVFHGEWLDRVQAGLAAGEDLLLVFPPADHTHATWRLAAVQVLAREAAPLRINAVASDDPFAIEAAQAYLADSSGVTGQYLPLDSAGAGDPLRV